MSDIPSASAVSTSSAAPVAASGNNIVVETAVNSVPDKILQLARQIEVNGVLAEPPANNTITLNTVIGPLVLTLPQLAQMQQDKLIQQLLALFQNQRPLTVVMQPGNPPSQALLLLPPLATTAQNTSSAANFILPPPAAQSAPPLLPNLTLSAVVLPDNIDFPVNTSPQPDAGPGFGFNANPAAVAGAAPDPVFNPVDLPLAEAPDLDVAAAALAKLQGQALPSLTAPQSAPVFQNAASLAAALSPPSGDAAALLQPGTELNLRVMAIMTPSAQGAAPLPPLQNNQIVATVTGNAPGGQLILKAGDATLFVRQPVNLPAGTQLVLTVEPAQANVPAFYTVSDRPQFAALQQIMTALMQIDPVAAQALLAGRLPQPGEALPGALLFFLSAVRQGDVRNWLGDGTLDLLTRAGKAELIGKLAQELSDTGQPTRDSVVGEWRSYPVPVQNNNQLGILYFHVHGGYRDHGSSPGGGDNKKGPTQVRFLIDVRMSRLGAMQLDGFLRPRHLDIVIRSENPLPPGLNFDLRQGYTKTLFAIGYEGTLSFQNGRQGWLNIQKPAAGAAITT